MTAELQTVDKSRFAKATPCMGGCEGGRESPCTFQSCKNRNIFQCFGFCFSSCRQRPRLPVTVIPSEAEGSFPVTDSQRKRSFDSLRSLKMTIRFEFVYNLRKAQRSIHWAFLNQRFQFPRRRGHMGSRVLRVSVICPQPVMRAPERVRQGRPWLYLQPHQSCR